MNAYFDGVQSPVGLVQRISKAPIYVTLEQKSLDWAHHGGFYLLFR
jgi:hypothetical protein